MITVYCLVDPRNNKPFYVGATVDRLGTRLSGHINAAKSYLRWPPRYKCGTLAHQKHELILDIINSGKRPRVRSLIMADFHNVDHYEHFFYLMFEFQGFKMLQINSAFGYKNLVMGIRKWVGIPKNRQIAKYKPLDKQIRFGN